MTTITKREAVERGYEGNHLCVLHETHPDQDATMNWCQDCIYILDPCGCDMDSNCGKCYIDDEPRPEILEFAKAMEATMKKHDARKGNTWKAMSLKELDQLFNNEIEEATINGDRSEWVDVANFCMMIWNRMKEGV